MMSCVVSGYRFLIPGGTIREDTAKFLKQMEDNPEMAKEYADMYEKLATPPQPRRCPW